MGKIFAKRGRLRAHEFLKKHDVFHISDGEYGKICKILEQNFAGIVLGRCRDGIEANIIPISELCDIESAVPLSLGYFGEIVYRNGKTWHRTGFYGFIDHRARVWCCGKIDDSIPYNGEFFYPYCIEPAFETLFFVKHAKLFRDENGVPGLIITPHVLFRLKILRKLLLKNLFSFAARFEKTKKLTQIKIGNP